MRNNCGEPSVSRPYCAIGDGVSPFPEATSGSSATCPVTATAVSNIGALDALGLARRTPMTTTKKRAATRGTGAEGDAALAAAAQGVAPTSDDADALPDYEERSETDVIGYAAGIPTREGEPLGGLDEIERRDAHRWELDPASADDLSAGEQAVEPRTTQGRAKQSSRKR